MSNAAGVKTAHKMRQVLSAYSPLDKALSVTQIAARTGMPKSTAHRIILSLREIGFLEQERSRDVYRLGMDLFKLGNMVLSGLDIHREARPVVEALTSRSQDAVHLCVFDGMRMVFVTHTSGGRVGRNNSTTVLEASPCYCTSVGKAALAFQSEAVIESIIGQGLQGFTRNTITDPDALRRELRQIRERGYAIDNGEMEPHVRCVGAPVRDARGNVIAGLSVSSTLRRLPDERLEEIVPLVIEHAEMLSLQLGYNRRSFGSY